jgi:hypothetical protein
LPADPLDSPLGPPLEPDAGGRLPPAESRPEPPAIQATPSPEEPDDGAVPPGYDWPTHGGYLGCLMGTIAGVIVGGFLGANLFSFLWAAKLLPGPIFVVLALGVFVGCIWLLGQIGWRLGRRYYHAYAQPVRPVWGEDDALPNEKAPGRFPGA